MSFDWGEYLLVAERLCDLSDEDPTLMAAACRAAVSRAYYSLYNQCLAHHRSRWGDVMEYPGLSDHGALEKAYREKAPSFTGVRKEAALAVADSLKRYRKLRNRADYEDEVTIPQKRVRQVIGRVEAAIGKLTSL